ncbi:hypothetical protein Tco_1108341 [Tanacetum coccineum]
MDFDFIPSHNDLGSDLDVSSPSGDRNKIYDPRICIEVKSTRFLATHSPVIDTLLPFSSENEEQSLSNHEFLVFKTRNLPPSASHRGLKQLSRFLLKPDDDSHGATTRPNECGVLSIPIFLIPLTRRPFCCPQGMTIPDEFLTDEIHATDDYKEYEMVFVRVDVPMNQLQSGKKRKAHNLRSERLFTLEVKTTEKSPSDSEEHKEPCKIPHPWERRRRAREE